MNPKLVRKPDPPRTVTQSIAAPTGPPLRPESLPGSSRSFSYRIPTELLELIHRHRQRREPVSGVINKALFAYLPLWKETRKAQREKNPFAFESDGEVTPATQDARTGKVREKSGRKKAVTTKV